MNDDESIKAFMKAFLLNYMIQKLERKLIFYSFVTAFMMTIQWF